jgi:hypothetical protein
MITAGSVMYGTVTGSATRGLAGRRSLMDPVIREALLAIERRDWTAVKAVLHPYLHWTDRNGRTVRGRNNVLGSLADAPPSEPPARHEMRDGQIYRWFE